MAKLFQVCCDGGRFNDLENPPDNDLTSEPPPSSGAGWSLFRLRCLCQSEVTSRFNNFFPVQVEAGGRLGRSSCSRYDLEQVQNLSALGGPPHPGHRGQDYNLSSLGSGPEILGLKQEECKDGWTFSHEYYESTVVTEVRTCHHGNTPL